MRLSAETKLPLGVTTGDRFDAPVGVVNATAENLSVSLALSTDGAFAALAENAATLTAAPEV